MARRGAGLAGRLAAFAAAAVLLPAAGPGQETRVVLLGDSITSGAVSGPAGIVGSSENGPGYAGLLAEALGPRVRISNRALGGTSTADWVAWLRGGGGAQLSGDVAVVLLGTNDALVLPKRPPIDRAAFRANVRALAAGCARGFGTVMLMTPPPAPAENTFAGPEWTARLAGYREEVLAACAEIERVECGPDLFALLDPRGDFHQGNIHPNARGHRKIADALAAALRPLVGRVEDHR